MGGVGRQDNPTEESPASVNTDEATLDNTYEAQIPEVVINKETMPVGELENKVRYGGEIYFKTGRPKDY